MRLFCLLLVAYSATVTRSDPETVAELNGPTIIAFGGSTLYGASAGGVFKITPAITSPGPLSRQRTTGSSSSTLRRYGVHERLQPLGAG